MTIFHDATAWPDWLAEHHDSATESWVVLTRWGATEPTSLSHQQALCFGWIDGLTRWWDEATYAQHYIPRGRRSPGRREKSSGLPGCGSRDGCGHLV